MTIKLWGDHGQEALESAHVCVVNATATGTEILKNLVLPGVGSFTIIDGNQVTGEDVGNSFFLQRSSIGQNRAQCATELLLELNNDVSGNFVEENPDKLLDNDPSFFCRFNVVIATQLPESTLLRLAEVLWNYNIPLLVCRTYGLIGYMRIVIKEHPVIESHPDNALDDLRLDNPFLELKEHIQSYDLDNMEKKEHSHIPWIVIVAKYLEKWYNENSGQIPKNYKEKEAFREMIRQGILKNENGGPEDEENFEEAIKNVNTAVSATKIPSCIEEIFSDDHCNNLSQQSPPFWILARAVKEFVAKEGQGNLPVRGTIPDMIADSSKFIKLQNIYRDKAKKDAEAVANYAAKLLQSIGKAPESISQKELKLLCSNSAFLRVVRCRSLLEEYELNTAHKDEIISHMDNPDSEMVLYLMLRAVDKFFKHHGRYPGVYNYQVEDDIGKLKSCLNSFLQEYGLPVTVKDDYVHELKGAEKFGKHLLIISLKSLEGINDRLSLLHKSPGNSQFVFCQQMLCTSGLFEDLYKFLTDQNSSVNLKRLSVYVLLELVSNNKSGQTRVRESGCLDVLLQLFRTIISESEVDPLDQNINQYHLWSSVCSTLCACVNNPQNEDNQKICTLIFPHAKDWLQNCIQPQIIRPICSFIALTVANNSSIQQFFASLGGLSALDDLLDKLISKSFGNCSNTKLAVMVTKTLDACIADNPAVRVSLSRYNIVPNLLSLLSHNILDSGDRFSVMLTLGHCTDNCALTESQDEQLYKAVIFVLQNARPTIEKLSLKLAGHSVIEDDAGNLEVDLQNEEKNLEGYWNEAKEILHRIKRLENAHQEEKMQRKTFNNNNLQEAILQNTSVHSKANASKQLFYNGMACTKSAANSACPQLIITECIKGSSKNELLKPANRNPIGASVSENEHNDCLHSKSSTAKRNTSVICKCNKSEVQASQFTKQPDFTNKSMAQQIRDTELLCSGIVPTSQLVSTSKDPKISELRCSGCETVGLILNSKNFTKTLQSCQYLCEQHKIMLETEMKYKMKLKISFSSHWKAPLVHKDDLQTKQDIYLEKHSSRQTHSFKDQDLNEKHTYSFEDENTVICVSDIPSAAYKKTKRRIRKDFTSEEIKYLLDGIQKMGHHWNSILWAYPFQKGRTNVDLAKKYCKLQKNEKCKLT
ncbi:hypothetical protein JRQ81_006291 [Phrynocephalus forsythii]|uniref:Myb-like domain-containing protein n=1 Tax=Phrynocephalus forsythii TaxID=171643 RepID=A0A9Q1AUU5_9SAUR|nr:hypothetical protein JRQ81_006291 [Phrynocephalus forsythii]